MSVDSDSDLVRFLGFVELLEGGITAASVWRVSLTFEFVVSSSTLLVKLLTEDSEKV